MTYRRRRYWPARTRAHAAASYVLNSSRIGAR